MTTDFRTLLENLVEEVLDANQYKPPGVQRAIDRACAALAEPEPKEPTDEELLRTYGLAKRDHCYEGPIDDWPRRAERAATVAGLRAVLAHWGQAS